MSDIEFVNGLIVKAPHERAPDFVKASISIKVSDLTAWLGQQTGDWVNADIKVAKSGRWYVAVNTYKKDDPGAYKPAKATNKSDPDDQIPF